MKLSESKGNREQSDSSTGGQAVSRAWTIDDDPLFGSFAANSFEMIGLLDREGFYLYCNPAYFTTLGYPPEELVGTSAFKIVHRDDYDKTMMLFRQCLDQRIERKQVVLRLVCRNGAVKWIDHRATLLPGREVDQDRIILTASDISEKVAAEMEIRRMSDFQTLMVNMAAELINLPLDQLDEAINDVLQNMAEFVAADRAYIFDYDFRAQTCSNTYEWCSPGTAPQIGELQDVPLSAIPDWIESHMRGEPVIIPDVAALPPSPLKEILEPQDIKSLLVIPLWDESGCCGFVGFDSVQNKHNYSSQEIRILRLFDQMLANVRQRQKTEDALRNTMKNYRQLQELFRNVADNMPDMLWAKDLDKRFVFVNKAICDKLLGATSTDEPIGKTDLFFAGRERALHPENKSWHTFGEICRNSDNVVMQSKRQGQFDEFGNIKGKYLHLDVMKSPLRNEKGEMIGTVGAGRDVTDRMRIEKIKNIQYCIASAVVETSDMNELIGIIHDQLNTLLDASNFYLAFYNDETGMFTAPFEKDEHEPIPEWPAARSCTGLVVSRDKGMIITRKEELELIEQGVIDLVGESSACWLGVPLHDDGKCIGAFVVQSYDNPEAYNEKDLEILEFISHQISIALKRKKYEQELKEALGKAQESDRLKSAFLANMSHEIRTPLNGILGFASLLTEKETTAADVAGYAGIIQQSGERLLELINNLIDISKIEAGVTMLLVKPFVPAKLFEEILQQHSLKVFSSAVDFRLSIPKGEENLTILSDEPKILQVLHNLIGNALKFTSEGYVETGFEVRNETIEFFVRDTGIGIPVDQQPHIFERFYQVDTSFVRDHEGAGLGLSICQGLVNLLGGTLQVRSEEGKGSVFSFTLPLVRAEIPTGETLAQTSVFQSPGTRILIAEDDDSSYEYLRILLERLDFIVYRAVNGLEAVEKFMAEPEIKIILMDTKMPVMDGFDATRKIRAAGLPVIIIAQTGFAMSGDREKAIEAGCDDYLAKPVRKNELLARLQLSLSRL